MTISPPMIVGLLAAVILIVILIFVLTGGYESADEGEGEIDEDLVEEKEKEDELITAPPPLEPPATCATHTCPDGYDKDLDEVVGDTDEKCCFKPLCDTDKIKCPSNKVIKPDARGLTTDECCVSPYCVDKVGGVCNADNLKLKSPEARGTTDEECCDTIPSCSSHVCGAGYKNSSDAANIYGKSDGECCVLKTCKENKWDISDGIKCSTKGLKWSDDLGDVVGNSEYDCCIEATCFENGFNIDKCGNPRKGGKYGNTPLMLNREDDKVFGSTHDKCCAPSKCDEDPIVSCSAGKTYKTPVPYAITEDECCVEKKCGDWSGECPEHKKRRGADEIGDNESQCCINKTCDDVKSDRTCPEGKVLISSEPIPGNYESSNFESTCCTDIKCGSPESTFKTEAGCNVTVPETLDESVRDLTVSTYALFKPITPLPNENESQATCCEAKLCSEVTNIDCGKIGQKKDLEKNGRKWNHGDRGGKECCKPKTCNDLKGEGMQCPIGQREKDDLERIDVDTLTGKDSSEEKGNKYQSTCCVNQKCSEITPNCAAVSVNGATNVMVLDTTKSNNEIGAGADHKNCCKFKTCSELGWTDDKCKDKDYTRAAYRGGLKDGNAEGRPPTNDDNAVALYGYENLGDKFCCEHKPKTSSGGNYARQCVSKEYYKGIYKRKSPGVNTTRFMGPKLNPDNFKVTNAEECKRACNQNNSCTTFSFSQNGTCDLFAGGSAGGSTAVNNHGGPPLRGIIGIELGGGWSPWHGNTRGTHYVTKNTFQNWSNGGLSGLDGSIGDNPFYTGKPKQSQIVLGKGVTMDENVINENRKNQLTTTQDAGNCEYWVDQKTDYSSLDDCEDTTWKGRREVLLAGVDEEFCPYDFFQAYDHSSSMKMMRGPDAPAPPSTVGADNKGAPAAFQLDKLPPRGEVHDLRGMNWWRDGLDSCGYEMGRQNDPGRTYPTGDKNKNDGRSTQQGINSCWSDPGCSHVRVHTGHSNPWSSYPRSANQTYRAEDETSSRIGISANRGTMESPHSRWARRMCYGDHISTSGEVLADRNNTNPSATLIKTRFKDTTDGNKKYTGRAPNKPTFSGAMPVEGKLLLSGDSAI